METSTAIWLAMIALALYLGVRVGRFSGQVERKHRARRRQTAALRGEKDAERLLCSLGYQIVERQALCPIHLLVDGEDLAIEVRADYLVSRKGRHYVAEVKTGDVAPSPRTGSTRRQLLEYSLVYPVDGTLLVDMDAGEVHEVVFPILRATGSARAALAIGFLWALLGAGLAVWLSRVVSAGGH